MQTIRTLVAAMLMLLLGAQANGQALSPLAPGATHKVLPGPSAPATPATGHSLTKTDVDGWLDGYLPYALRSADIPGAEVVVVKDGQILTLRGYGYADSEKRTLVDPARTLFRPGSISKLFTWTAVMQQVEQGKINLDGDINQYLDIRIPPWHGQPVTMRQLMTHTGGFEEVALGVAFYDPKYALPLDLYLKRWVPKRIFAPGTTPAYSNWGTALAAYIVQRVSHQEFNEYLEQHIFAPLGMANTTFRQPLPAQLAGQMATGYPKPGEPKPFEYVGPAPAGAASTTASDMARFMIAHLQRGSYNGAQILQPATADMMHNSPLGPVNPKSLLPPLNRMELGFFETNLNGREIIGHLGDTSGFHSSLHLFMADNVGLYLTFNGGGKDEAVQALRTSLFDDFADRYFPNIAPPDGRVDVQTATHDAQLLAGHWMGSRRSDSSFLSAFYWLAGQTVVSVGPRGELVIPSITNAGGRPRQWVEIAPFLWRDAFGHDRLAVQRVNGQIVRWSYDFASPFEVFDRVPASRNAAWLVPAVAIGVIVLVLTLLNWPLAFLIRRRFGAAAPVTGRALQLQRASRLTGGLLGVVVITWAAFILSSLGNDDALAGGMIPGVWALKIVSIILFVLAVPICGWNAWANWTDGRHWTRKLWSTLVFLATLLLLYVAITFHVLALNAYF